MSTHTPDELMSLWAHERLSPERAVGQLLQHLVVMHNTLDRQAQAIAQLRVELAAATSTTVAAKPMTSRRLAKR